MTQPIVEISGLELVGRDQFHDTFARLFGFPRHYGRNMDAWLDCMSDLPASPDKPTARYVTLTILIHDHKRLREAAPQQWNDLIECTGFLNKRGLERGEGPILALAF